MRKIFLIISLAMCSLFANAQQLEPNYHYSFWSNWSIGAGAVYSKPIDATSWWFNNGANLGADVRLEKPLSNAWTIRIDACVPGIKNTGMYDRYGTIMGGANLNLGRYVYLFGDAGMSVSRFGTIDDFNLYFCGDAGLGGHIYLSDYTKFYIEVGSDCCSKIEQDNANLFGKIGIMSCIGTTRTDKANIAKLHEQSNYVPRTKYDSIMGEMTYCNKILELTIKELENTHACCNENYAKYEKEISELKAALTNAKDNAYMPFSVLFDKNSTELSKTAKEIISQIAIEMNKNGGTYTLYGFGDYTGSNDYNEVLSGARCESVKSELIKNGVSENNINVIGLGKSQYFGSPESYINRRVMFVKD